MHSKLFTVSALVLAGLAACGGGGGTAVSPAPVALKTVAVPVMVSDAAAEDWSKIQVSVLSLTLTDTTGATTAITLPSTPYVVNLAQLDNLGEVLSSAQLTPGTTYTQATLTISANPGDVVLKASEDPHAGFAAASNAVIAASDIQLQGATGAVGSKIITLPITLSPAFTVPAAGSATTPLNLEFDLSHPAFIVGHVPMGNGATKWAVNFNGPIKQKHVRDITHLLLRHSYGTVSSVSADMLTLNFTKDVPTRPLVSPQTAQATAQALAITVDATNGTLFYDVDAKKEGVLIKDFSSVSALLSAGEFVRVAARYQPDGSLVATRIWASSSFNGVFVSPEGHVLHVNTGNGSGFSIDNAEGASMPVKVTAATQFYFRNPGFASDVAPIGTGPAFLKSFMARGFKVRVTPVDVTASPITAAAVDIEAAPFEGQLSAVTSAGFTLVRGFKTPSDAYPMTFSYIDGASANGKDPASGNAISGFKFWEFGYPSLVTSGAGAVASFVSATNGSISFGGAAGSVRTHALTYATWGDPASTGWAAPMAILIPSLIPRTTVASTVTGNSFGINAHGGATAVTVNFSTKVGSATLVYQVDRTGDVLTVSPQDITTPAGLAALTQGLTVNTKVAVSAVPQADGTLKADVITYDTGMQNSM